METDTRLYPSGSTTSLSCITLGNESLNKPTNLTFLIKAKFEVIRTNQHINGISNSPHLPMLSRVNNACNIGYRYTSLRNIRRYINLSFHT